MSQNLRERSRELSVHACKVSVAYPGSAYVHQDFIAAQLPNLYLFKLRKCVVSSTDQSFGACTHFCRDLFCLVDLV